MVIIIIIIIDIIVIFIINIVVIAIIIVAKDAISQPHRGCISSLFTAEKVLFT